MPYEVRALRLVSSGLSSRLLCGDRSGLVKCLQPITGMSVWSDAASRTISALCGGPVYDFAVLPEHESAPKIILCASGHGSVVALDYNTGGPIDIALDGKTMPRIEFASPVMSCLPIPDADQLWIGTADGALHRYHVSRSRTGGLEATKLQGLRLEAPVSGFAFMPAAGWGAHPYGSVAATTRIGNAYVIDVAETAGQPKRYISMFQPIRSCLSLAEAARRYDASEFPFAIACGGSIRLVAPKSITNGERGRAEVTGRHCADRVFCLGVADFGDTAWIVGGANDARVHFYRVFQRDNHHRDILPSFGDRHFSIRLPERVLSIQIAPHSHDTDAGCVLFLGLGNHAVRAIRIFVQERYERTVRDHMRRDRRVTTIGTALNQLEKNPDDQRLRNELSALFFRTDWLRDQLRNEFQTSANRNLIVEDFERVVYRLLANASVERAREIIARLSHLAIEVPEFGATASRLIRHIDKYAIDGRALSDKRSNLETLATFNERNGGEFLFEAALYRAIVSERRAIEEGTFAADGPIHDMKLVELPGDRGSAPREAVLATSFQRGRAYLVDCDRGPLIEFMAPRADGNPIDWLQHSFFWKDPVSGQGHLLFFFRDDGWTSVSLSELARSSMLGPHDQYGADSLPRIEKLATPREIREVAAPFWIYSSLPLPGGLVAAGGRTGEVSLLQLTAADHSRVNLAVIQTVLVKNEDRPARIRTLAYRPKSDSTGELFAGCDDGVCYRYTFDGVKLSAPIRIWQSRAEVKAIAFERARLFVGDLSGHIGLLQQVAPDEYAPTWTLDVDRSITGAVATTMRVRQGGEAEPVILASDAIGRIHLLRTAIPEYDYRTWSPVTDEVAISSMVLLSRNTDDSHCARVAVARFDQGVRILRIPHRRYCVSQLSKAQAALVTEQLVSRSGFGDALDPERLKAELTQCFDGDDSIADQLQRLSRHNDALEEQLAKTVDMVAWKLASANTDSGVPPLLAFRLQYDGPDRFARLVEELRNISLGKSVTGRLQPQLRLKYALRFAFRALADRVNSDTDITALRAIVRVFSHTLHELCTSTGAEGSDDRYRCRLHIAHYFFRFATPMTLELLLDSDAHPVAEQVKSRSMTEFVRFELLDGQRLSVRQRTVQYIRRMIAHDTERSIGLSFRKYLLPLLVDRMRACTGGHHDPLAGEILHCIDEADSRYSGELQAEFISHLIEKGCSASLLQFVLAHAKVTPFSNKQCAEMLEVLANDIAVPRFGQDAAHLRLKVFQIVQKWTTESESETFRRTIRLVRVLSTVAVAFDPEGDPVLQQRAQSEVRLLANAANLGAGVVSNEEVAQLLACAHSLIESAATPIESGSTTKLYRRMREQLAGLAQALRESDDVLHRRLFDAQMCVRRRTEIELDFLIPLRYLQERPQEESPVAGTSHLARSLQNYVGFYHDISAASASLVVWVTRHGGVKTASLVRAGSSDVFEFRTASDLLAALVEVVGEPWAELRAAVGNIFSNTTTRKEADRPTDKHRWSRHRDLIQLELDADPVGILVFMHSDEMGTEPSRQALSRMIAGLIVDEYIRALHRQRLVTFTFHNIMQPVESMIELLTDLKAGLVDRRDQPFRIEELLDIASKCRLMITNNQNFIRLERGLSFPISRTAFDLIGEVELRRRIVGRRQKKRRVSITPLYKEQEYLEMVSDRVMVGDIVQNLLDNACKHSPDGAHVEVSIGSNKDDVFIEISDNGPGLPNDVHDSMWEDGARGKRAIETTREGLGLGLFMVKQYVTMLNGTIWAESVSAAEARSTVDPRASGATFTVRLPLR